MANFAHRVSNKYVAREAKTETATVATVYPLIWQDFGQPIYQVSLRK